MAERRPPGFNVDLGFYDSDEVLSIPRKIRAAAIGVWTLCGAYSANKLTDGLVSAEALRDRGCTTAIRAALLSTEPEPLWEEADLGAIRFTRWAKWQRTAAEIKDYREAEAERKRKAREAKKNKDVDVTCAPREPHVDATWRPDDPHVTPDMRDTSAGHDSMPAAPTSRNSKTSGRTSAGRSQAVRPEDGDPKTKTETETNNSHLTESATDSLGSGGIAATPGAELVRELIPDTHPAAVRTQLRIRASELIRQGHPRSDVAAALELWLTKPSLGPNALPSVLSEVVKARAAPNGAKPTSKLRATAELAAELRAEENAQLEPVNAAREITR
jgi:hypothetical protein